MKKHIINIIRDATGSSSQDLSSTIISRSGIRRCVFRITIIRDATGSSSSQGQILCLRLLLRLRPSDPPLGLLPVIFLHIIISRSRIRRCVFKRTIIKEGTGSSSNLHISVFSIILTKAFRGFFALGDF